MWSLRPSLESMYVSACRSRKHVGVLPDNALFSLTAADAVVSLMRPVMSATIDEKTLAASWSEISRFSVELVAVAVIPDMALPPRAVNGTEKSVVLAEDGTGKPWGAAAAKPARTEDE